MVIITHKGYYVPYGYMGHIGDNKYRLFVSDTEYDEWYNEIVNGNE